MSANRRAARGTPGSDSRAPPHAPGRSTPRSPRGTSATAAAPPLGGAQQIKVDLDVVHLLHAADVRVPELLVRVRERTRPLETRRRVHDLVAVNAAAPALELVLWPQRELACALSLGRHGGIVGPT